MNYFPWSNVIPIGLGYLDIHVVSTKLAIDILLSSSYCYISNHPVIGSITGTDFMGMFYFLPFSCMTQGLTRYKQSLFHGIPSADLADNLPYFYLIVFYLGKCHN